MKLTRCAISVALLFITWIASDAIELPDSASVRLALEAQIQLHPHSTLRDIYKSFFQDYYGPAHIIPDRDRAKSYLLSELETTADSSACEHELTGADGRFVRVDLAAVKSGLISADALIDALCRSTTMAVSPKIDDWRLVWERIDSVVQASGVVLPDVEADREFLAKVINSGNPEVHHSDIFTVTYDPHYRIISREIFEAEIHPLLHCYAIDRQK